jgi:UDP-glucose 4-epimerase
MSKNYLVTGGAGFIGSHVVDLLLEKKKNVYIIDNFNTGKKINLKNKKVKLLKHDISIYNKNFENFFKKIDVVIHLAGIADLVPSINNPTRYFDVNVKGTLNVLEACKKNKIKKIVYAASASCYGLTKKTSINENFPISTKHPYALSKKLGEDLVVHWGEVFKLNVTSLRLFNVFGLRSRTSGAYGAVFGVFLAQKLKNKPLTIVGSGNQTRDFVYVKDVAEAFFKASQLKENRRILNIASGKEISVNKIANMISRNKIHIPKRPGEPDRSKANIDLAKKILKWKPKISVAEGVKIMLSNIKYWNDAPVWDRKNINKATAVWFKYLK